MGIEHDALMTATMIDDTMMMVQQGRHLDAGACDGLLPEATVQECQDVLHDDAHCLPVLRTRQWLLSVTMGSNCVQ